MAKKVYKGTDCKNCGMKLTGDYCHACGQRADEPRRIVIGLVQDFLVDTLAIDGKLARSIGLLLWRPARLARRYLDGRRVHYSPPFRLYLFASVFFFIAAFWMFDPGRQGASEGPPPDLSPSILIGEDALREIEARDPEAAARLRALQETTADDEQLESVQEGEASDEVSESAAAEGEVSLREMKWEDTDYNGPAQLEPHAKKMFEAAQRVAEDPRLFLAQIRENLPRVLLLAPVVYALILLLLYCYRRKFYVYDHFVIALYMHAALYAYLLLALMLSLIPVIGGWIWIAPLLWGVIQPFAVFRQAYGSNWVSVGLKGVVLSVIYLNALILIITFGLTYSLYQS